MEKYRGKIQDFDPVLEFQDFDPVLEFSDQTFSTYKNYKIMEIFDMITAKITVSSNFMWWTFFLTVVSPTSFPTFRGFPVISWICKIWKLVRSLYKLNLEQNYQS